MHCFRNVVAHSSVSLKDTALRQSEQRPHTPSACKVDSCLIVLREKEMTRSSRSSNSKKQVVWEWSAADDRDLLEACKRFGSQWHEVEKFVGRSRVDCMERWDVIMPLDWKSFCMLSWPDEDILRLLQAVRSNQYDNEKRCFVSTKPCDWSVVATIMNVDDWRWDAEECEQMWYELQSVKPFRLGDFSKLEDDILAERVLGWGLDQRGLWRWLSDILKRDHVVLRSRWNVIKKDYVGYQSSYTRNSEEPSLHGSAQLSSLGRRQNEQEQNEKQEQDSSSQIQSEACHSLFSTPVASSLPPNTQVTAPPGFTPTMTNSYMRIEKKSHGQGNNFPWSRIDTSFDSVPAGPASRSSAASSRLIDLSFFSSRSFSEQDASPTARRVRQKTVHSPLSETSSSHSNRAGIMDAPVLNASFDTILDTALDPMLDVTHSSKKSANAETVRDTKECAYMDVIDLTCDDEELAASQLNEGGVESVMDVVEVSAGAKDVCDRSEPEAIAGAEALETTQEMHATALLGLFNTITEDSAADVASTTFNPPPASDPTGEPSSRAPPFTLFSFDNTASAPSHKFGTSSSFGFLTSLGAVRPSCSVNSSAKVSTTERVTSGRDAGADTHVPTKAVSKPSASATERTTARIQAANRYSVHTGASATQFSAHQQRGASLFGSGASTGWHLGSGSTPAAVTNTPFTGPSIAKGSLFKKGTSVTSGEGISLQSPITTTTTSAIFTTSATATATTATTATTFTPPQATTASPTSAAVNINIDHTSNWGEDTSRLSLAAEGRVNDAVTTEEVLINLAKRESEQDAELEEAIQLSLLTHSAESSQSQHSATNSNNSNNSHNHSNSNTGGDVPVEQSSTLRAADLHNTEEELLQLALQASMQDCISVRPAATTSFSTDLDISLLNPINTPNTTNTSSGPTQSYNYNTSSDNQLPTGFPSQTSALSSTVPGGLTGERSVNIDASYVNFSDRNDYHRYAYYWPDDDDEGLMQAIERSLHE